MWEEIESVVASIDAETCRTKVSEEKTMKGRMLYSPIALNIAFNDRLEALGWKESRANYWLTTDLRLIRQTIPLPPAEQKKEIEEAGLIPIRSYTQTDFVRGRVAIEVQFGKYSFLAFDLFVRHMAFYVGDVIDVGIEIIAMKEMQEHMSSGPGYYEFGLYSIIRQGRGVPAVPLVVVGVAP